MSKIKLLAIMSLISLQAWHAFGQESTENSTTHLMHTAGIVGFEGAAGALLLNEGLKDSASQWPINHFPTGPLNSAQILSHIRSSDKILIVANAPTTLSELGHKPDLPLELPPEPIVLNSFKGRDVNSAVAAFENYKKLHYKVRFRVVPGAASTAVSSSAAISSVKMSLKQFATRGGLKATAGGVALAVIAPLTLNAREKKYTELLQAEGAPDMIAQPRSAEGAD